MNMKKFLTVLILCLAAFAVSCSNDTTDSTKTEYLYIVDESNLTLTANEITVSAGNATGGFAVSTSGTTITVAQNSGTSATEDEANVVIGEAVAAVSTLPNGISRISVSAIYDDGGTDKVDIT